MPAPDYTIRQNDFGEAITATLEDSTGSAVNIVGGSVKFHMQPIAGGSLTVDAPGTITNGTIGAVAYTFGTADTAEAGVFLAEWQVTYSGGQIQTFPNGGYTRIQITPELG